MTTLAEVTAAPMEWTYNGVVYRVSPLRDQDFAEFELWVQSRYIDLAKRTMADLPPEQATALLTHAYDKAALLTISSPEVMQLITSLEGGLRLAWLSLRREQPTVTLEQVSQMLSTPAVFEQIMELVTRLNGGGAGAKKNGRATRTKAANPVPWIEGKCTGPLRAGTGGRRRKLQR